MFGTHIGFHEWAIQLARPPSTIYFEPEGERPEASKETHTLAEVVRDAFKFIRIEHVREPKKIHASEDPCLVVVDDFEPRFVRSPKKMLAIWQQIIAISHHWNVHLLFSTKGRRLPKKMVQNAEILVFKNPAGPIWAYFKGLENHIWESFNREEGVYGWLDAKALSSKNLWIKSQLDKLRQGQYFVLCGSYWGVWDASAKTFPLALLP